MLYKKLLFQLIVRIALIILNSLLFAYLFVLEKFISSQINLLLLLIIQGIFLVRYLNKANRDLSNFFSSVINKDSSIVFSGRKDHMAYANLHKKLDEVNKIIEQARIEKAGQYEYVKQVVDHVGVGILSFDDILKVQFFNPAGKDILKISKLTSIKDLDRVYPGLAQKLSKMNSGTQQLINIKSTDYELNLSVKLVEFKIHQSNIKLIAFQDIQSELNRKEVESWQKIIRVLTHEIMNSVSPIDSATTSISRLYMHNNNPLTPSEINDDIIHKTIKGMNIIHQRSKGMLKFVENFRDLTLLPEPDTKPIKINDLFQAVITLLNDAITQNSITIKTQTIPHNITLYADISQIEQVIINLIKNSIEALTETKDPIIKLQAYKNENSRTVIQVIDNGKGINQEIIENVFTPFFTTKEVGSGIGLSLSQQIMHLHGGNISVKSEPNVKTLFTLTF